MCVFHQCLKVREFKLQDVSPLPWNRPVATFMANGRYYYIDVYRLAWSSSETMDLHDG
jgi:hypothetical protein